MKNLIMSIIFIILGIVVLVADIMTGASIPNMVVAAMIIFCGIINLILDIKRVKKNKEEK